MSRQLNLRELFGRYPLGCESFGAEWLRRWEAVGRLLSADARLYYDYGRGWSQSGNITEAGWLIYASDGKRMFAGRIVLLNGTVVKEWGPK